MPRNLKRYHGRGDLHFISFSCYERRALLGTVRARDVFLKTLEEVRRGCAASVVDYVIMPEHGASVVERAEKGNTLEAAASFEATRLVRSARPEEKKNQRAIVAGFSRFVRRAAPILAT
jgi:REP element-mobilizing transposase RayT